MERKEINILDYFFLLYKSRMFIIANFIVVVVLAGAISFVLPIYYQSKATIFPPEESSEGFGFGDVLSRVSSVTKLELGTRGSPADLSIGIMKSDLIQRLVIDRFDLIDAYKSPNIDAAKMTLTGNTDITLNKEGMIEIVVVDREAERCAAIANTYIALLDSIRQEINQKKARDRADFLEKQLRENETALSLAENQLKDYQLQNKAISPYVQQRVALNVSAELELELMRKENQLELYRSKSLSDSHPLVKELLSSIRLDEEMLQKMRFGGEDDGRESLFVPLQEAPDRTMEYTKLESRVEFLGMLDQYLRQQYEESRISQMNTASTITVLDQARPPEQKDRPKRKMIVLVAGAASLFFSVVSVLIIEYLNRLTEIDEDNRRKIERLARFMRLNN